MSLFHTHPRSLTLKDDKYDHANSNHEIDVLFFCLE